MFGVENRCDEHNLNERLLMIKFSYHLLTISQKQSISVNPYNAQETTQRDRNGNPYKPSR